MRYLTGIRGIHTEMGEDKAPIRTNDLPRLVSIDEVADLKLRRPAVTSRARGWNNVTVDLYPALGTCRANYPALDHHLICYCPSGSARLIQKRGGVVHTSMMRAGISLLMPAGYDSSWEGATAASARLRIPTALTASAIEEIGARQKSNFEIRNVFEARDTVIERVAQILIAEIDLPAHPAQSLIVDQVSLALAAHMLRTYNALEPVEPCDIPPFGKIEIARITEYIESNLGKQITLKELANINKVSRFHFARLFKRSTGVTAISFVEQCRIRRAQSLIIETDIPLVEIALMTGFADQSHFTRRFHRRIGCTPAVFAREHGGRRRHAARVMPEQLSDPRTERR